MKEYINKTLEEFHIIKEKQLELGKRLLSKNEVITVL